MAIVVAIGKYAPPRKEKHGGAPIARIKRQSGY
jgi:hypothetical protein